jgi:hypothetical protein
MLKKNIIFFIGVLSLLGCSHNLSNRSLDREAVIPFSCEEEAPPKSLQELEKKYRCKGELK